MHFQAVFEKIYQAMQFGLLSYVIKFTTDLTSLTGGMVLAVVDFQFIDDFHVPLSYSEITKIAYRYEVLVSSDIKT